MRFEKGLIIIGTADYPERRGMNRRYCFGFAFLSGAFTVYLVCHLLGILSGTLPWIIVDSLAILFSGYMTAVTCYLGWFRKGRRN